MQRLFKSTVRAFSPMWGNFIWWIILVLYVIFQHYDRFLFKQKYGDFYGDWIGGIVYVVLSIILSFIIVFIVKLFGYDKYFGTSPNIEFVKAYPDERIILYPADSQTTAGTASTAYTEFAITGSPSELLNTPIHQDWRETTCCFAHVVFENKKRKWSPGIKTAYQVTANIRFLDENNNILIEDFTGRWGNEIDQPNRESVITSSYYTSINMIANGRNKYELNIAMKYRSAGFLVAFNNESYFAPSNNLMLANRTVGRKNVIVEVTLKADNIDEELIHRFELSNMGIGNGLEIRKI